MVTILTPSPINSRKLQRRSKVATGAARSSPERDPQTMPEDANTYPGKWLLNNLYSRIPWNESPDPLQLMLPLPSSRKPLQAARETLGANVFNDSLIRSNIQHFESIWRTSAIRQDRPWIPRLIARRCGGRSIHHQWADGDHIYASLDLVISGYVVYSKFE